MANGHGGKRPGAGRKKKPLADKILEGTTKQHKPKVLNIPEIGASPLPEAPEYMRVLVAAGVSNDIPRMKDVFEETANWLKTTNCLHLINPQLITQYAILTTRWLECEDIVSRALIVKTHNKDIIANPMAAQALQYKKAADIAWDKIWAIITQNCEQDFGGRDPQANLMEKLLKMNMEE
jgi:hypothetical protein